VAAWLDADQASAVQKGLDRVRTCLYDRPDVPCMHRMCHDVHVRRLSRWPPGGVAAGYLWGRTSTHA
jgi:hypothetical protein